MEVCESVGGSPVLHQESGCRYAEAVNRRDPPLPPYPGAPPYSSAAQPPVPPGPQLEPILTALPRRPAGRQLLVGTATDDAFLPKVPLEGGIPTLDGRAAALASLGSYLLDQVFARPGQAGAPPIFFRIPPENFSVDRPNDNVDLIFPSVVALPGPVENKPRGFQAQPDPNTVDLFGPGTVVYTHGEIEEVITLEVWSSNLAELRSIVARLEQSFFPSTGDRGGFLLLLPDYFGVTARFMFERAEYPDDGAAVRDRRRAHILVFMSFDVCRLGPYRLMVTQGQVDVEIPTTSNLDVAFPSPT
jgi:hypothetical protein